MIADPVKRRLDDFYFTICDQPAWLALCKENTFSPEELEYLEQIAVEYEPLSKRIPIESWIREVEAAGGPDVYAAANDDERIKILSRIIYETYLSMATLLECDRPYYEIELRLKPVRRLEAARAKIIASIRHKQKPADTKTDALTDQEIARARAVPLDKLVPDLNKFGYTVCRWHDDHKPSMLVKNGFGFCFSCGAWCDSIKWLLEIEHLDFKSAVRALNRIV